MNSYDESCSSSSSSSAPVAIDEYEDENIGFRLANSDAESSSDESSEDGASSSGGSGFKSADESSFTANPPTQRLNPSIHIGRDQNSQTCSISGKATGCSDALLSSPEAPLNHTSVVIPHRGAVRRILNPSSFHAGNDPTSPRSHDQPTQTQLAPSSWPMYAINVAAEGGISQNEHQELWPECYQIIFDRQQYEFCTRLFALLDTESQSFIGPDCIREFIYLYCPVVRRRDEAIRALSCGEDSLGDENERNRGAASSSPTFDEIWERTIHSDPNHTIGSTSIPSIHRIGIEGWMVFCRLLALAHHQESQRRFASRHLQQMMRHKHGGGATRVNPNEIVVMVDNPPPGPPGLVSIRSLVEVERERAASHSNERIQGWPFCPLPPLELDLDDCLVSTCATSKSYRQPRGAVVVEPFSSSREGDFILRFSSNDSKMVVRRSYSDFEWLNAILKLHKRPGQGHLCGRILPPFPSKHGGFDDKRSLLSKKVMQSGASSHQQDMSERAIAAAKTGIGMISSIAKSVWTGYVSGSTPASSPSKTKAGQQRGNMPSYLSKSEDIPAEVAKRIERYLNHLLENALSTSFPLHAVLQASQSGLESAKQILQDHSKRKKRQRSALAAATSSDGPHSAASIFSALVSKTSSSILRPQEDDDTPWLRASAQVAMALQFHGVLETTGHESASAKIQHASLPRFRNQPAGSWDDEDAGTKKAHGNKSVSRNLGSSESDSPKSDANFEVGVVEVESELADEQELGGYDMLPSPGPSDEHRVLNAGSNITGKSGTSQFVYEMSMSEHTGAIHDRRDAVLGSIRVEADIDKLRDIIRSINHTLGKLHRSSALIRSAQDSRNVIQLSILRDIDSWGDDGAELISQRALVDGVAAFESINSDVEDGNKSMADDLFWQSSLATSAVAAVNEVRDAVKAAHTASRAKSAAFIAAEKAKKAYEACDHTSSQEKIQHTQSQASAAQSHAIHATVVEYEANIAKKRSAVSLAQDVKSWNIHRKKELLRTCIKMAKSQQEACRKAADAWESFRGGLIDSSDSSFATGELTLPTNSVPPSQMRTHPAVETALAEEQEHQTLGSMLQTSWDESHGGDSVHNQFGATNSENSSGLRDWETSQNSFSAAEASTSSIAGGFTDLKESQQSEETDESSDNNVYCLAPPNLSQLDEDYFSFRQDIVEGQHSDSDEEELDDSQHGKNDDEFEDPPNADVMSTSMQSLIDGLMAWGEDNVQGISEESNEVENVLGARSGCEPSDLLG